jgi:hypothetical protein
MRPAALALIVLCVACGSTSNEASGGDAGSEVGAVVDAPVGDAPPDIYRFTSDMDGSLVAAEVGSPSTVCCDSAIGCYTSPLPGVCTDSSFTTYQEGDSFRFWFLMSHGGVSLTVQTAEPDSGFTGACLLGPDGRLSDRVQLPAVCFSPAGNVQYDAGTMTEVLARGVDVLQSDTPPTPDFEAYPYTSVDYSTYHFQVLMTCYPKDQSGTCTVGSPVSRSCCDIGANMSYLRDALAHGFVNLTSQ